MNAEAFWQDVGEGVVSCNDRAAVCFQDVADHWCIVDIEDFERDVLGVRQSVAVSDRELVGHSTELVIQRSDGHCVSILSPVNEYIVVCDNVSGGGCPS